MDLDGLLALQYLHLSLSSVKKLSVRNLPSLKHLVLYAKNLNKCISTQLFENLSNLRELKIVCDVFSDINLDDLVNLGKLSISGKIDDQFNFELFKIICNNLQELSISLYNISNEQITQLFYGLSFPNLVKLNIEISKITKLEKKMFEGFPRLQSLTIANNEELRKIAKNTFSNLTNLVDLNLSWNCIDEINKRHFSKLMRLKSLDLKANRIESIEDNIFSNLKKLKKLDLCSNNFPEFNPKSLIGLVNLKYLDISYNGLTYFDPSIFHYLCKINRIRLSFDSIDNRDEIR